MTPVKVNREAIDGAARELARAVHAYNASKATGKGRRTIVGYVPVVAKALGRKRLGKSLFAAVVNRAIELRIVEKQSGSSGRVYLVASEPKAREPRPEPIARTPQPKPEPIEKKSKGPEPASPPPSPLACSKCGAQAETCWHCSIPVDDSDVYVDSAGFWCCGTCNDLTYRDSWGGYRRWHLSLSTEE